MLTNLILASRSPRRQKILADLGLHFKTVHPDVTEVDYPSDPDAMVRENAWRKWEWCRQRFPSAAIIAADTTVELDGQCLGKPHTREAAFAMLKAESGRTQTVHTGYVLALPGIAPPPVFVETSRVVFRELTDDMISAYIDAVNPLDRAGAYDIDDAGQGIISRYEGSYTNIMGLPAERIKEWIECNSES
jgi:septum formation protein